MTTANKITIFRVILIPVFLVLMYLRFPGHTYWAFGVFVLASLSDFADGYIARHYNQVSDFGKFMDPPISCWSWRPCCCSSSSTGCPHGRCCSWSRASLP